MLNINNKVFISFISLVLMYGVNLFFPILLIPYLNSIFGPDVLGEVIVLQSIFIFLGVVVNFGFDLVGPKEIAESPCELYSKVVYSIVAVKFSIASVCCFFLLFLSYLLYSKYVVDLFFLSFYLFGEVFLLRWYFQGVEKMLIFGLSVSIAKCMSFYLIFSLVNSLDDRLLYLQLYAISNFLIGFCSFLFFKFHNRFFLDDVFVLEYFKKAKTVFLTYFTVAIKDKLNVIFVSALFGPTYVVAYDFAIKVVNILVIPSSLLVQAVYPSFNKRKSKRKFCHYMWFALFYGLISTMLLLIFGSEINMHFINTPYVSFFETLFFSLLLLPVSGVISRIGFIPFGLNSELFRTVVYVTSVYLLGILLFFVFDLSALIFAMFLPLVIFFEVVIRLTFLYKLGFFRGIYE